MCNIFAHADDVAIRAPTRSRLQSLLDLFYTELNNLDLTLNVNKSEAMIFHKDKTRNEDQSFALGENPIQFVNTFKYVGTILNENLTNKDNFYALKTVI